MAANGSFVVSWTSTGQDAAGTDGVYFRQYDATGTALTGETLANTTTSGNQQNASVAMQSNDSFVVTWSGNGVGDANGVFAQLYVDGNNLAPVNTVPGAQSTAEDTALIFSGGNGNQISIADADAHSNPIQVTITATNGTLTLASLTGLTFTAGDGTNDLTMTMIGTATDINAALNGLTFMPTTNFVGTAGVAITTNDLGYSGTGGAKSDSDNVAITVTAVNDPPVNTVTGTQSTPGNTALSMGSATGNQISVSDVDAASGEVQVTLNATNGTITLAWPSVTATSSGSEFRVNTNTSDRQGTLNGEFYGGTTDDFGSPRAIAVDDVGNFVVTWSSKNQDGDGWGIFAQRYDSTGAPIGSEFQANTTTTKNQVHSSIAMDDSGNFVIVWSSQDQDGNNWGIFAQRYDASGAAQGGEFQVNTFTNKEQLGASVAMDGSGELRRRLVEQGSRR